MQVQIVVALLVTSSRNIIIFPLCNVKLPAVRWFVRYQKHEHLYTLKIEVFKMQQSSLVLALLGLSVRFLIWSDLNYFSKLRLFKKNFYNS